MVFFNNVVLNSCKGLHISANNVVIKVVMVTKILFSSFSYEVNKLVIKIAEKLATFILMQMYPNIAQCVYNLKFSSMKTLSKLYNIKA